MQIPRDIHLVIVSLLSPEDIVTKIRRLSRYWKRIVNEPAIRSCYTLITVLNHTGQSADWKKRVWFDRIYTYKSRQQTGHYIIGLTDRSMYYGDYYDGREGFGIYSCQEEDEIYVGEWHRGYRHGKGEILGYDGRFIGNVNYNYGRNFYIHVIRIDMETIVIPNETPIVRRCH